MIDITIPPKRLAPPRLILANGTLEALKWMALLIMTGDHVNKYLFNATQPVLFELGRLALPIFVVTLAYNLARPIRFDPGMYRRTITRLAVFGALASVPFLALGKVYAGWWPLNVLFTLLTLTTILYLVEGDKRIIALVVFLLGGSIVEFCWPALLLGLTVWSYCKRPTWAAACSALLSCVALCWINGNLWALMTFPLLLGSTGIDLRVPRLRWVFYTYYPLHLGVLWLIRIPMRHAGYLFF